VSVSVVRPIPEAILWHDGMLLTPEHFQQMEGRLEAMVEQLASSLPFHWGVSRCTLDLNQLQKGKVVLLDLQATLPDGFYVQVRRTKEEAPALLDLGVLDVTFQQQPFFLFLAVLASTDGDPQRLSRYVEAPGTALPAQDDPGLGELPIPYLEPRIQIIASSETPSSKFASLPLARLGIRNETWVVLDDYQAPVRQLADDSPLLRTAGELLRRVRELAIVQHTRWQRMTATERGEVDSGQREAWRALVATLPVAEALLAAGSVQPFRFLLSLCSLAGSAAALTPEAVPPLFPPYRHTDINASFAPVLQYLTGVLSREEASAYAGFPFRYEREVFSLMFSPDWVGKRLVLAMRGPRESEAATRAWGESALIGARPLQERMRGRRVLGATRTVLQDEPGLSVPPGVVLFALNFDAEFLVPGELLEITAGPRAEVGRPPLEIILNVPATPADRASDAAAAGRESL
jgi:type VI secretion system protein ImpJ